MPADPAEPVTETTPAIVAEPESQQSVPPAAAVAVEAASGLKSPEAAPAETVPEPVIEAVAVPEPVVEETPPPATVAEPEVETARSPAAETDTVAVAEVIPEPVVEAAPVLVEPAPVEVPVVASPGPAIVSEPAPIVSPDPPIASEVPAAAPVVETATLVADPPAVVAVTDDYVNPCDVAAEAIAGLVDLSKVTIEHMDVQLALEDAIPAMLSHTCLREGAATPDTFSDFVKGKSDTAHHAIRNQVSRKLRRETKVRVNRADSLKIAEAIIGYAVKADVKLVADCYAAVPPGSYTEE